MQIRIIVASALLAASLTGCGGGGKTSAPTPAQAVASPPSVTSTPVTPTPAATATPPAPTDVPQITMPPPTVNQAAPTQVPPLPADTPVPPAPPPPPADTHVSLVAEGTRFRPVSLTAPPGGVTIVLDNRDNGIPHDVNVFSDGTSIGSTSPAAGPITETLALGTLAPGTYSFVCDVHPLAMHGVLTVGR